MLARNSKVFLAVSLGFLVVAIVLAAWGLPRIVSNRIQKTIQIDNSSKMYSKWVKMPMPLDFKIHVFNVTNRNEINQGQRPKLAEIGPYVYKEYRERVNIEFGENDTVTYMVKKTFVFDKAASGNRSENDILTVVHYPYMAAIQRAHGLLPAMVPMINKAFEVFFGDLHDPFMKVKVRDLFFDGIFVNCVGNQSSLPLVCGQLRVHPSRTMRRSEDGKGYYFSMFSHLNRTLYGPYKVNRGTKDIRQLGHIVSYKNMTSMANWKDPYCGQINGSDGTKYPPIDENNVPQKLYSFEADVCRSMYASFVEKRTFLNMTAYYFEISSDVLAAKTANPDNKCFCRKNWSGNHDGCLMMGVLNLAPCQGSPAIVSLPHFYLGSEEIREFFAEGIKPDKDRHNSHVYLEPATGVVLKGVKRLQFNIEMRAFPKLPQLERVPTGLFPLLWISEGAEIPVNIQRELLHAHAVLGYVWAAQWALPALAVLCVLLSGAAVARASQLTMWPRAHNSVSFVLTPAGNKAR